MAIIEINFESKYLGNSHPVSVVIPSAPRDGDPAAYYASGARYPVLWLLHGTYADHTDWLRKTQVELFACERGVMVVLPNGLNANYANWPGFATGFHMFDYLTGELMPLVYNWLPASRARADNFIAGASMGGRGALLYALNRPELFAAAASFSCPLREGAAQFMPDTATDSEKELDRRAHNSMANAGGIDAWNASCENTLRIAFENAGKSCMPRLYFAVGQEDALSAVQRALEKRARAACLDAVFEETPGYGHEWRFWNLCLEKAMDFFGLPKKTHMRF